MSDPVDVVRDARSLPLNNIDPDVTVPPGVKAAVERAAALHELAYPKNPPIVTDTVTPPADPPAPAAVAPPAPPAPPVAPTKAGVAPNEENLSAEDWKHKFLSMQGRYSSSQKQVGSLQDQLSAMGDELMRSQHVLRQIKPGQQAPRPAPLLTDEDRANYGPELIDVIQRAATAVVAPEVEALKQRNAKLERNLQQNSLVRVYEVLDTEVPNWRAINEDDRFHAWLALPDIYSGGVRSQLLKASFNAANAARVVAFFKGFLAEEVATGNRESLQPQPGLTPTPPVPPRDAARKLEDLATPGRAQPAPGNSQVPAAKPTYTRAQVAAFYDQVRAGAYNGREKEKAVDEAELFAAQKEGRIR